MRVLIVDNDAVAVSLQARVVAALGHEAHTCVNGAEAVATIERLRPEAVILDLAMPGVTGLDIADELQHRPDLRPQLLIALTGFGSASMEAELRAHGFDHYFLKPVDIERLKRTLSPVARKPS